MILSILRTSLNLWLRFRVARREYVYSVVERIRGGISPNMFPGEVEAKRTALALGGNVDVGRWTVVSGGSRVYTWTNNEKVIIGKFCSIAWDVQILAGGEHGHRERVSNYHFRVKILKSADNPDTMSRGMVIIGHDVWIGARSTILSGVTIGDGTVIAAGAVLTKSVPPYAIVVGNPARVVGYRFPEPIIKALLRISWWDWSDEQIVERCTDFYGSVDQFVSKYDINTQPVEGCAGTVEAC